ncbi:MAG: hypothetical protein A3A24_01590 [Candidatus Buchananbacteria bacterium RIFCSPLOWO2_01_FULL_46_12]|uniref:Glycosyltransferase 2-like domain-containing protein n=2 Tax=Candidatus Buchananiibacteriota TaxID=1817903 RepID=A0A1G1YT09_9BACT|nr:MAG: hypothetical protein A2744_04380 [Candidatus Buchananbacteria bacterium RIFCSPHIGHO2_01_FULL_44_11]OGY55498.1 MAG: hypothetical protein A3A24_01590 [Candidatus Buchananbacteria bacterium RIFCSPLOWO2_01_FULL_46_12]
MTNSTSTNKTVIVVPTYWSRPLPERWRQGDAVYDHPTALNEDDTLGRFLNSINILRQPECEVVVLVCVTTPEIEAETVKRVRQIVASASCPVPVYLFSDSHLRQLQKTLTTAGFSNLASRLSLRGYSSIRNACLLAAQLRQAELAVLIDDDEVFEDPEFLNKARQAISAQRPGIAGYYVEPDNQGGRTYIRERAIPFWMKFWNKFRFQNESFRRIIGQAEPRLKVTPFAFGGNLVIHQTLFSRVPFDPLVNRGEDMDYVMNAKMFDVDFYLDNHLAITHLPPVRSHPQYRRLAEDMNRFSYQRSKLHQQRPLPGLRQISASDFNPYPGYFLGSGFILKVIITSLLLSLDYLSQADWRGVFGALANMRFIFSRHPAAFSRFIDFQRDWRELMTKISALSEGSFLDRVE